MPDGPATSPEVEVQANQLPFRVEMVLGGTTVADRAKVLGINTSEITLPERIYLGLGVTIQSESFSSLPIKRRESLIMQRQILQNFRWEKAQKTNLDLERLKRITDPALRIAADSLSITELDHDSQQYFVALTLAKMPNAEGTEWITGEKKKWEEALGTADEDTKKEIYPSIDAASELISSFEKQMS